MKYFLLVYDRRAGRVIEHSEYPEADRTRAFADREAEIVRNLSRPDIEVVLLGADNYENLAKTHARYFKSTEEIMSRS